MNTLWVISLKWSLPPPTPTPTLSNQNSKLVSTGKPLQHFHGVAAAEWNRELFGSLCTDLVPDHLVDLKNEFAGNAADTLYRFWPSAKRAKQPFSVMLPGQVRL